MMHGRSRLVSALGLRRKGLNSGRAVTVTSRKHKNVVIGAANNYARSFSALALQQQPQRQSEAEDYSHLYTITSYHPHSPEPNYPSLGPTTKLNLFTAINSAMKTAMAADPTAILFGEDVAFGGVFRCSQDLREEFGEERVFNTPLSENGFAVRFITIILYKPWAHCAW